MAEIFNEKKKSYRSLCCDKNHKRLNDRKGQKFLACFLRKLQNF